MRALVWLEWCTLETDPSLRYIARFVGVNPQLPGDSCNVGNVHLSLPCTFVLSAALMQRSALENRYGRKDGYTAFVFVLHELC